MASGGKAPKPTDPELAAAAQARWNRTGQQTPFGSVEWQGNNQVVTPNDAMMQMFGQAQGIATGGAERYQTPENFGDVRSQVMQRLQNNQYQPGSRPVNSKPTEQTSLAKGTPFRDAFFGPVAEDGERHTTRHILRGGLQGAIPRGFNNLSQERTGNSIFGNIGNGLQYFIDTLRGQQNQAATNHSLQQMGDIIAGQSADLAARQASEFPGGNTGAAGGQSSTGMAPSTGAGMGADTRGMLGISRRYRSK